MPSINARFWCAIVVASRAGANTGDFAARYLDLGHTGGLLPLVAALWRDRSLAGQGRRRPMEGTPSN